MDLTDLYQDIILDHGKSPRNKRDMPGATHSAQGFNPLCGDQITVWLRVEGEMVSDASFTGQGCAISQASASMMTLAIKGQSLAHAEKLFASFRGVLTTPDNSSGCDHDTEPQWNQADAFDEEELGQLSCLTGVKNYPNRIKCATLAWHAMHSALAQEPLATTE